MAASVNFVQQTGPIVPNIPSLIQWLRDCRKDDGVSMVPLHTCQIDVIITALTLTPEEP